MDRMTSRRVCRCFIVLLAAMLTAGASVAQVVDVVSGVPPAPTVQGQPRDRAPARRVGTAVIRGRVVDGVTGAPVPRARVRVMNGPTSSSPVLTDAEGAFEFTKLPSGPTTLVAEKATYMLGRVPEVTATTVRARMQPLVLRDGQLLENVTISLFHGGAIAGRIVDAHGDPVENAQVRAARVVRSSRPQTMGQVQSNDLGEYRLPRLQPGRYIVQVRPQPSQGFQGAFMEGGPADVPLPQPIPTYYPGALAISQAQPLTVARGETLSGVDIMLVEGTPSLVTGTVVRGDGGPVAGGSVTSRVVGSEMSGGFDFGGGTGIRQGGVFQITLPPGEYVLEANAQMTMPMGPVRPSPEDQIFGTARITVGGGAVEAVTIVVGHGATASGKVVFEGTTPAPAPPGPTNPPLFNPDGPGCRQGTVTVAADWTFKVEGLGGTCAASPQPMFGRWTVKSVVFRGQNIFDQQMTFESGQHYNDIQIVVTDKRTQIDLQVAGDDGQPTREYVAILFPADKSKWGQQSRRTRIYTPAMATNAMMVPPMPPGAVASPPVAEPAGAPQRFTAIQPGEYFLVAVDDIGAEDWQDPGVLERLAPSATRVAVTDEAPIEVPLRRVSLSDVIR